MDLNHIVKRALTLSCIVIVSLAIVASIIAGIVGGPRATGGVLVGAFVSLLYSSLTGIAVMLGSKRDSTALIAIVFGGWMLKMVVFFGLLALVRALDIVDLVWCFWALVVAAVIGLALDSWVLVTAKMPYVDVLLPTENPEDTVEQTSTHAAPIAPQKSPNDESPMSGH